MIMANSSSSFFWLLELEEISDPRVKDWLLMSSPLPTVFLCLAYFLIEKVLGPLYMQGRKPYNLKYPMLAYNLFQVLFNGWIFQGKVKVFRI